MPELLNRMLAFGSVDLVQDQDGRGLEKEYAPAMREAGVGAGCIQRIGGGGGRPFFNPHRGFFKPAERAGRDRLIAPVNAYGVVGPGAAEAIPLSGIGDVGESAGVDQNLATAQPRRQAEGVGMAVTR